MQLPADLLHKYNTPIPRYTSYPPANHFNEKLSQQDAHTLIEQSNQWDPSHIAIYVHIPFCRKICFYCGCNACTAKSRDQVSDYLDALKDEIRQVTALLNPERRVTQVHFGGGTPNAIEASELKEITDLFRSSLTFADRPEMAIELNPAYLDMHYLETLLEAGFNRFSLGIQDFNKAVLDTVNREPSSIPVEEISGLIRSASMSAAINLDFIYGLPGQTSESFRATIDQAISLQPDRLVTFAYAHVPWLKKHQVALEKAGLPGPEARTRIYLETREQLKKAGYIAIGLDHFVLPGDELSRAFENNSLHRNFQGYCTRQTTGQVYAFGNSAISQLDQAYIQNTREVGEYIANHQTGTSGGRGGLTLSSDQMAIREVITRLMCNRRIHWKETAASLNMKEDELKRTVRYDSRRLQSLQQDNIIKWTEEEVKVTETGSLFIRNVAAVFDPAYKPRENNYSKSV